MNLSTIFKSYSEKKVFLCLILRSNLLFFVVHGIIQYMFPLQSMVKEVAMTDNQNKFIEESNNNSENVSRRDAIKRIAKCIGAISALSVSGSIFPETKANAQTYDNYCNYLNYANYTNYANQTYGNYTAYANYKEYANYANYYNTGSGMYWNYANYVNWRDYINYTNYGDYSNYVNYTNYANYSNVCS